MAELQPRALIVTVYGLYARRTEGLDGTKTWISNGGIADQYGVFARSGEGPGAKGLSAFVVDAAALLVYRAAWTKDAGAARVTSEAAMAKMFATEAAQRVIDRAVQLFGGLGVTKGVKVEELYREIRALRIYEGATEVQKIVIAREALRNRATRQALAAE